jgi:hypothetical protein
MSIVSEAYDILFLFFAHVGSIDLLIDKQELTKNKVLKAKGLCGSDNMDVSVRRQFKGKIFGFRINPGTFVGIYHSLHRAKRQP